MLVRRFGALACYGVFRRRCQKRARQRTGQEIHRPLRADQDPAHGRQRQINGKGPYRFVFDTGATYSLVNNKVAKEAELFSKDFKKPLIAFFGVMGQVKMKTLELGDLKAENASAMVLDHPTVEAISKFVGPIEGILGFTFYARYKMSIDYEKNLITFEPGEYQPAGSDMEAMVKKIMAQKSEGPRILAPAAPGYPR